jgi:hypothetical protein
MENEPEIILGSQIKSNPVFAGGTETWCIPFYAFCELIFGVLNN